MSSAESVANEKSLDRKASLSMPDLFANDDQSELSTYPMIGSRQFVIGSPETYRMPDLLKKLDEYKLNHIHQRVEIYHLYRQLYDAGLTPRCRLNDSSLDPANLKQQLTEKDAEIADLKHKFENGIQEFSVKVAKLTKQLKVLQDGKLDRESLVLKMGQLEQEKDAYASVVGKLRKENQMLREQLTSFSDTANESDSSVGSGLLNQRERVLFQLRTELLQTKNLLQAEQQKRLQLEKAAAIDVVPNSNKTEQLDECLEAKYRQALTRISELEHLVQQGRNHLIDEDAEKLNGVCDSSSPCKKCDRLERVIAALRRKYLEKLNQAEPATLSDTATFGLADGDSLAMWLRSSCQPETRERFKKKFKALYVVNRQMHDRMKASTNLIKTMCEKLTGSGVDITGLFEILTLHSDMLNNMSTTQSLLDVIETTMAVEGTVSQLNATNDDSAERNKLQSSLDNCHEVIKQLELSLANSRQQVTEANTKVAEFQLQNERLTEMIVNVGQQIGVYKWPQDIQIQLPWLQAFSDSFFKAIQLAADIENSSSCALDEKQQLFNSLCDHITRELIFSLPLTQSKSDDHSLADEKCSREASSIQQHRSTVQSSLDIGNISMPPEHVLYGEIKGAIEQVQQIRKTVNQQEVNEAFDRLLSMMHVCEEVAAYMVKHMENSKEISSNIVTSDKNKLEISRDQDHGVMPEGSVVSEDQMAAKATVSMLNFSRVVDDHSSLTAENTGSSRLQLLVSGHELVSQNICTVAEQMQTNNMAFMHKLEQWEKEVNRMKQTENALKAENEELLLKVDVLLHQLNLLKEGGKELTASGDLTSLSDLSSGFEKCLTYKDGTVEKIWIDKPFQGFYQETKEAMLKLVGLIGGWQQDDPSRRQFDVVIGELNKALSNVRNRSVLMSNQMKRNSGTMAELKAENAHLNAKVEALRKKLQISKTGHSDTLKMLEDEKRIKASVADELLRDVRRNVGVMKSVKEKLK